MALQQSDEGDNVKSEGAALSSSRVGTKGSGCLFRAASWVTAAVDCDRDGPVVQH